VKREKKKGENFVAENELCWFVW